MDVVVQKPTVSSGKTKKRQMTEGRQSTFYNPLRCPLSDVRLADQLCPYFDSLSWPEMPQYAQLWSPGISPVFVDSNVGLVPKGSVLSYQQKLCASTDSIIVDDQAPDLPPFYFPDLSHFLKPFFPLSHSTSSKYYSLFVSPMQTVEYERLTRSQSDTDLWHKLRFNRLTASKFKNICSRRKDFDSLVRQLLSRRLVQTAAMKYGIDNEPVAAECYSKLFGVNVYRIGFIIHPQLFFLGCSPDRRVYEPDSSSVPWGLLEIKCTVSNSVSECDYLEKGDTLKLKRNHIYYYQVVAQMGLTGSAWCDFFVYAKEDFHCERIYYDDCKEMFSEMIEKILNFFFNYFILKI